MKSVIAMEERAGSVLARSKEQHSQNGRIAVSKEVSKIVEFSKVPVRCVRVNGELREATTGRAVLPLVQAAEDVLYSVTTARPEAAQDGRRTRSCRGLTLVKGAAAPEPTPEARPIEVATAVADKARPRPELAFYRKYTEAMLRRYVRMSTEIGRTPSLLGREMFRARVTSYRMTTFEDSVAFCIDTERCLAKLLPGEQSLIKRIALQEYSQGEAAGILGLSLRATVQRYGAALDRLTGIFLAAGMLEPLRKLAEAHEAGSVAE